MLRRLEDLGKEFPDQKEVEAFVSSLGPLLAEAMYLRSSLISDKAYYIKAKNIEKTIKKTIRSPASHPGIQRY